MCWWPEQARALQREFPELRIENLRRKYPHLAAVGFVTQENFEDDITTNITGGMYNWGPEEFDDPRGRNKIRKAFLRVWDESEARASKGLNPGLLEPGEEGYWPTEAEKRLE